MKIARAVNWERFNEIIMVSGNGFVRTGQQANSVYFQT
jgi:hypothetical protein